MKKSPGSQAEKSSIPATDKFPPLRCCNVLQEKFAFLALRQRKVPSNPSFAPHTASQLRGELLSTTRPSQYGCFPKNRGKTNKRDGENNGKPYKKWMIWGKPTIFGNIHINFAMSCVVNKNLRIWNQLTNSTEINFVDSQKKNTIDHDISGITISTIHT